MIEVSWQPGLVRSALAALAERTAHWTYVSSVSAYASHEAVGAGESAPLLPAAADDEVEAGQYGEAKVACEQASADAAGDRLMIGPVVPFGIWIEQSRTAGGHTGPVVQADPAWLAEQKVAAWMGPESLAMWLAEPGWEGFCARSGEAARAAGLKHRPRPGLLADLLGWEREQGLNRARGAGLSAERERELITALPHGPA